MIGVYSEMVARFPIWRRRIRHLDVHVYDLASAVPRNARSDRALNVATELARGPAWVVAAAAVDWRRSGPRTAAALACAWMLTSASENLIKSRVKRERPFYPEPSDRTDGGPGARWSFPSGHATGAFACATCLSLLYPRRALASFASATGVALARIYLRLHYPSDCLAGAALGAAIGTAVALPAKVAMRGADRRGR